MERTVADAALNLWTTTSSSPASGAGPGLPVRPRPGLRPHRQAHQYNDALPATMEADRGALEPRRTMIVERTRISISAAPYQPSVFPYRAKHDIVRTSPRLRPERADESLTEEIADVANAHEALKFGNNDHTRSQGDRHSPARRPGPVPRATSSTESGSPRGHRPDARQRHAGSERRLHRDHRQPAEPDAGRLSLAHDPDGLARRGGARSACDRGHRVQGSATWWGFGYVMEQGTMKRKPRERGQPGLYRCARRSRRRRSPSAQLRTTDYAEAMAMAGTAPRCRSALETESAENLQERMTAGTLSAETLTKAYLARIALTDAEGPAIAGRPRSRYRRGRRREARSTPNALFEWCSWAMHGIPVLLDNVIDARGLRDDGRSIALRNSGAGGRFHARLEAGGGGRDHPRQDERLRAERPVRREHAGGLLLARRPGAAAVGHGQDARPARRPASAAATAAGLAAIDRRPRDVDRTRRR